MHKAILAAAVFVSLAAPEIVAADNGKDRLVVFPTQAEVEVDSSGTVVAVTADRSLSPAIRQVIEADIRQWHFSAPTKADHPVGGVTFVQMDACAAPRDGKYLFVVKYRGNGPGFAGKLQVPRFPPEALRYGNSAKLQLTFRVLPSGRAQIEDIVLIEGDKHSEKSFKAAMKSWLEASRFSPEQIDGEPVATRVSFPIEIDGMRIGSPAAAKAESDKRMQELAAQQPECQEVMSASDANDRQVALDSPFHLLPAN
jgi:hypothetical protein